MRGDTGVNTGTIISRQRRHYCSQCAHYKATKNRKGKKLSFCLAKKCYVDRTKPDVCRSFKKKWKDAIAGEVTTYKATPEDIERLFK